MSNIRLLLAAARRHYAAQRSPSGWVFEQKMLVVYDTIFAILLDALACDKEAILRARHTLMHLLQLVRSFGHLPRCIDAPQTHMHAFQKESLRYSLTRHATLFRRAFGDALYRELKEQLQGGTPSPQLCLWQEGLQHGYRCGFSPRWEENARAWACDWACAEVVQPWHTKNPHWSTLTWMREEDCYIGKAGPCLFEEQGRSLLVWDGGKDLYQVQSQWYPIWECTQERVGMSLFKGPAVLASAQRSWRITPEPWNITMAHMAFTCQFSTTTPLVGQWSLMEAGKWRLCWTNTRGLAGDGQWVCRFHDASKEQDHLL